MGKSIKKNFVFNVLLNISKVIFPLITAPYVSRVLEPDGVGLFNFANTYAGYFTLVAMLGIPTYGIREVPKYKEDKVGMTNLISQILSIAVISTVVVSVIYVASIFFINQLTENYVIFLLAGFLIYLSPFSINWFFQGKEEFGFITIRTFVIRTLSLIALFIFVKTKNDLIYYIILNVLGSVVADLWNYAKMRQLGIKPYFTLRGLKPHMAPLLILFASSIAVSHSVV